MTDDEVDLTDLVERIHRNDSISAVYKAAWIAACQEMSEHSDAGHYFDIHKFAARYGVHRATAGQNLKYLDSLGVVNYTVTRVVGRGTVLYLAAGPYLYQPESVEAQPLRNGWGGSR